MLLLAPACRFDHGGRPAWDLRADAPDAAAAFVDLRVADVSGETVSADLSNTDGQPPDLPPPDLSLLDLAPPDLPLPDLPQPDLLVPCTVKYGGVNGFKHCAETATECVFYFVGGNCDDHCGNNGGTCIKSADDSNNGCDTTADQSCSHEHSDGVCHCSR